DLGREEFLQRVLEWQDKHGGIIIEQLKRLGCSCDWSRQRYTLDQAYASAVKKAFVDLYQRGLIYRGRRMIHWDPAAQTALSDDAIDPEFGTGVLKVTPAHDVVDFEIGQRHNLPIIDVLHPDGRINCPAVPELNGLDRFEARERAAELLQARGALAKMEPYEN